MFNGILSLGPALMMKELEKYTGSYEISPKSHTGIAEESTAKNEKIQNKMLDFFL